MCLFLVFLLGAGCGDERERQTGDAGPERVIPQSVLRLLVQAQAAQGRGEHGMALALVDSAQRRAPDLPDAHFLEGSIRSDLSDVDQAEAAFKRVVALEPNYRGAWFNLGNTAVRQGQLRQALSYYAEERERHPTAPLLTYMGRVYARLGEADSARQAFEGAIDVDADHAPAYAHLGQLYEDEGRFEEALALSQRALALAPANLDFRYIVGAQLLRTGQAEGAAAYLRTVIEQRPWHYGAHYNLGQALVRLGRRSEAQHFLTRADSLQELQSKVEHAQVTAETNPGLPMNWVRLGEMLRQSGRIEEALEAYQVARSLAPENLAVQHNLANLFLARGDTAQAVGRYRTILQQDSTFTDAWLNLGVVYALSGEPDRARQAWQNVLRYVPGHSTAKTYLAQLRETL